jgi:phage protein D
MLHLGYDNVTQYMGKFVVDEVELEGYPETIIVRARSATFDASKGGESQLQTQKNRRWNESTLTTMVKTIAKEHGLEAVVSKSIQNLIVHGVYQVDESDLHFLLRICRRFDGAVKVAAGKLIVAKKAEGKTMSGKDFKLRVVPSDVTSYHVVLAKREESGTVRVYWHNIDTAKRHHIKVKHKKSSVKSSDKKTEIKPVFYAPAAYTTNHAVTVGNGDPETSIKTQFTDQATAIAAAKAELSRRARQKAKLTLTMPGHPELAAEVMMTTTDFRDGVNGDWIITSVVHNLGSGGYTCTVEAEIAVPADFDSVENIEGADDIADTI